MCLENIVYNFFVDLFFFEIKCKSKKVVLRIFYFYKRKSVVGKVIFEIVWVFVKYIEGMEF